MQSESGYNYNLPTGQVRNCRLRAGRIGSSKNAMGVLHPGMFLGCLLLEGIKKGSREDQKGSPYKSSWASPTNQGSMQAQRGWALR